MTDSGALVYAVLGLPVLYVVLLLLRGGKGALAGVPTVGGPSWPLLSYIGAFNYLAHAPDIMSEGYKKAPTLASPLFDGPDAQYKNNGGMYKFAEFRHWTVMLCDPAIIEEVRRMPEAQLSQMQSNREFLQVDYTLGSNVHENPYHVGLIRSNLTRNLTRLFPELHDEVVAAFGDAIRLDGEEWTKVPAMDTMLEIVCRTINRVVVGLPSCRNSDFCDLNKTFTIDTFTGGAIISLFPEFLKPLAAKYLTKVPASVNRGIRHLEPVITERFHKELVLGDEWTDKPNDMLQWCIDTAQGEERTVRALTLRILASNTGAIHTSTMCMTHALFYLAAHPQYVAPLRAEVESTLQQGGWTKESIRKMRRLESFLKEVLRLTGVGSRAMNRKVMEDFRFSNGIVVPAGNYLAVPTTAIHHDEAIYEDPDDFKPWRFYDASSTEDESEGSSDHLVTTSAQYMLFGHGKQACPGRFLAVSELKTMLAHVLMTYDVRMEDEGVVPPTKWFATALTPNATAAVLFRKRRA
ncbi:cytochrome P450 [Laetiporus sulphureus 93-53]|uniref:Cytochrome P450 n=1 Tax=Laetiporus sulphureus 93-53 TaxID=1314785 RepID=A0A165F335_9APHY|nr:cytochrome P450 [Laetiporus sulphureus 93-53]KZT08274.1 cytochrome P450 [Laetiporus sulphureus 93-53]